ncbi:MAG: ABC transporter substrate-binding protein [Spirochaetales bacterium]|nr:ABC transporter substrate-binding protein [Spirochaetales bacterium]
MKKSLQNICIILLTVSMIFLSACKKDEGKSIVIAEQYGLAYAPLQIIKANKTMERLLPEVDVTWVRLGNTAAIREAVIAGKVDAGFLGIPPFLIARDKGMDWKIFTGLSRAPLGLVADTRKAPSLDSLLEERRIALPQPGSIQHILLSMEAERTYGDHTAFDKNLVALKHPDGMNGLISGSIDAHFTSPPFIFQEIETESNGEYPYKVLLTGEEAFGGEFTFIVGMVTAEYLAENEEIVKALKMALAEGMNIITSRPAQAAKTLSGIYDLDEEKIFEYLTKPGTAYTTKIQGLDVFIDFMERAGYLQDFIIPEQVIAQ